MAVELEIFNVLVDEAPPDEGHQIQKADGVEARVPSLNLLRQEDPLLALEVSKSNLTNHTKVQVDLPTFVTWSTCPRLLLRKRTNSVWFLPRPPVLNGCSIANRTVVTEWPRLINSLGIDG